MDKDETFYTDKFIVKNLIGQGGVGRVFLGYEKDIGREVAIKELIPEKLEKNRDRKIARFIREAKISGRLQHPGIVPVYQLSTKADGSIFYSMKYVEGITLAQAIVDCDFGPPESSFRRRLSYLEDLISVCETVGFAHSKEIIHRDLKPENIVLGGFGETVILDWGLAKHVSQEEESEQDEFVISIPDDELDDFKTKDGALLGTPSYMSPEQIDKRFGRVDYSSDVYALGTILFILLTGRKPYNRAPQENMKDIASTEPAPSPTSYGSFIAPELSAICEKAMSKKKEERFQNAFEMAEELKAYRDGRLVSVYGYSKGELFKRFIARNKIVVGASVAVILSILIGAGLALDFAADAHRARVQADKALVDVTNLSESAAQLARQMARDLDKYFDKLILDIMNVNDSKTLQDLYPGIVSFTKGTYELDKISLEGSLKKVGGAHIASLTVPVGDTKSKDAITAVFKVSELIPKIFGFDPLASPYQVWCMNENGRIVYDEDPLQVGKYLFADEMYTYFPELLEFGAQIQKEPWGVGHYSFLGRDGQEVHKVAAWDTALLLDEFPLKVVVTYPYSNE